MSEFEEQNTPDQVRVVVTLGGREQYLSLDLEPRGFGGQGNRSQGAQIEAFLDGFEIPMPSHKKWRDTDKLLANAEEREEIAAKRLAVSVKCSTGLSEQNDAQFLYISALEERIRELGGRMTAKLRELKEVGGK